MKQYFILSFEYTFKHEKDEVEIAYCVPYTYSKLMKYLKQLVEGAQKQKRNIVNQETLCQTMGGLDVPLLTVTDFDNHQVPMNKRRVALINARIHPGEANGSWMMHGVLDFLFSDSMQAKELLKK